MSRYPFFDGPCDLRYDAEASSALGKEHWRRLSTYRFMLSVRQWVCVPAGGLTDKGSIPMVVNNLVPRDGRFEQAYDMHDQLCEYLSITIDGKPESISRARADGLLYVAMGVLGASPGEIFVVRAAVDSYRNVANVHSPSNTALKRSIEAQWRR